MRNDHTSNVIINSKGDWMMGIQEAKPDKPIHDAYYPYDQQRSIFGAADESFVPWNISVSYTHLDVYKRQSYVFATIIHHNDLSWEMI